MAGFLRYLRFIARRERIASSLWIWLTAAFTLSIAAIFPSLLGDETTKNALIEMLKSPAMVGMMGPVYGTTNYTVGIAFAQMMTVWIMIAIAAMNIFFVNRHTRADEEQGRLEMLRSLPVGRLTNSAATIIGAFFVNAMIAVLSTLAILAVDLEGCTFAGAFAYSFEISAFGFLMAAATLLCGQLFSTSRGSSGAAFAMLGVFYLMRAAGDYTDGILSYLSPMGLGLRVFAFHENNLYPMLIQLLETAALLVLSFMICAKRDLGEGVIPAKKGRAHAKKRLLSPFGLAMRLTQTTALVWCAIVFCIAAMYGSMLGDIDSFVQSNDFFRQLIQMDGGAADTLTVGFITTLFMIMAHIAAIPVITIADKLRSEESHGRLEQIFARSVKRWLLLGAFAGIAFVESVLVLLCTAAGLYAASIGTETLIFVDLLKAAMCYLPALWMFAGMSVLLTGIFPRGSILVWLMYAYSFSAAYLGRMLNLPQALVQLSPFGNVPQLPLQELRAIPLALLTLLAAAFVALGIWRFNERDIA